MTPLPARFAGGVGSWRDVPTDLAVIIGRSRAASASVCAPLLGGDDRDTRALAGAAYARAVTRRGAAVGSLIFVVLQPGLMGGLVPYLLTGGWESAGPPLVLEVVGAALVTAGVGFLAHTVIRFAVEGLGTPSPAAPTENLVVGGVYRYLRNPMYVAVIAVILGQAAILGRPVLLVYAALFWLLVASFVRFYEEPTLSARYGEQYTAYRRAVRGWWPRLTPWDAE